MRFAMIAVVVLALVLGIIAVGTARPVPAVASPAQTAPR